MRSIADSCISCGTCAGVCPTQSIFADDTQYRITESCIDCSACEAVCPVSAISEL